MINTESNNYGLTQQEVHFKFHFEVAVDDRDRMNIRNYLQYFQTSVTIYLMPEEGLLDKAEIN